MEIARLIALLAGVYLAARFSTLLSEYIYKNTTITWEFLPIVCFGLILVSVIVLVYFFGKVLEGAVKLVAMGWADKAAGAFFGLLRGAFLVSLLLLMMSRFSLLDTFNDSDTATNSYLYGPIQSIAPFVMPILDEIDRDTLMDRINRTAEEVEESIRSIIPE